MKLRYFAVPLAAVIGLVGCSENTQISALLTKIPVMDASMQEALHKSEIIQLAHAYGYARDNYDGKAYANVFAKDGKFNFRGEVFQGREAIAARVPPKSEATGVSMHFVSTSHVELTGPRTAKGVHYGFVYLGDYPEGSDKTGVVPGEMGSPGIYTDSYILTEDEGWKIAERTYQPIFGTPR